MIKFANTAPRPPDGETPTLLYIFFVGRLPLGYALRLVELENKGV